MQIENESQLRELYFEGEIKGFKKVYESELYADCKSEVGTYVVEDLDSGKHYQGSVQRTGEYWNDYDWYFDSEFEEVELREVTVQKWIPVKP